MSTLDPLIFNVLRRCVNLFVAMLVSDDVAVSAAPFERGKGAEQTEAVLEQAFASAMERSKVKTLGRMALRNACVDGDGCFYMHFDPEIETGQDAKGDIQVDCIDNTNVYFGNTASDEVERQPYILIALRRDVDEVKMEALQNRRPSTDINAILAGRRRRRHDAARKRPACYRAAAHAQSPGRYRVPENHAGTRR